MGSITGKCALRARNRFRNDPGVVKRRFIAVTIVCFGVLLHIGSLVHKNGHSFVSSSFLIPGLRLISRLMNSVELSYDPTMFYGQP